MSERRIFRPVASALGAQRLGGDTNIAAPAGLMADEARAAMLLALGCGRPLSASQLAAAARVRPPTASSHLAKLVGAGLLRVERNGRFRYYRIASPAVSAAIEALGRIAPIKPVRALSQSARAEGLRVARTCYDHLAGQLGVALFAALVERDALCGFNVGERSQLKRRSALGAVALGTNAPQFFRRLAIDLDELEIQHRQFAYACLDWTENEPHLGGSLGAALCATFLHNEWCRHRPHSRALLVTERGREALRKRFGVVL